jgi:tetratricopeptide (TPR) repeat protein
MAAIDLLVAGHFEEAIAAYQRELDINGDDAGSVAGLASAYMGAGLYREAIPLKWRLHELDKVETPDHPGQHLYISCAHWCLDEWERAIELAYGLCAGILNRSIGMAPDLAGGATFGLILHYMGITAKQTVIAEYAVEYLRKLNVRYDRQPVRYQFPKHIVKQILGQMSFEDALEGATKHRTLDGALKAAVKDRSKKMNLGEALFHDGLLRRVQGDEAGCLTRMKEVFNLGYQTEPIHWYIARHEVGEHSL